MKAIIKIDPVEIDINGVLCGECYFKHGYICMLFEIPLRFTKDMICYRCKPCKTMAIKKK